jgi:peptidoglycan hydrolase-like protein with peptidoglycan-binding domain
MHTDLIQNMQTSTSKAGQLQIRVRNRNTPVSDAKITISYTGDPQKPIEEIRTDGNGQTEVVDLAAPPLEYSMEPSGSQPYAEYTIQVTAEGATPVTISGTEILPGERSIQEIQMTQIRGAGDYQNVVIPAHTLYGNYPPKIAEAEIKPVNQTGEIVLSRVVIPEYIVVHDGAPTDSTAEDYYIPYRDYVKNVASSEIYATWPRETIKANVLAIMSFTLNRVYTEWYRNKGYDFTITSSTAFDHKWIYSRNIFESISEVVDEIFEQYLARPDVKQPILTQYCDGQRVNCPNWMSQWGSKALGDQGYSAIQILRNYYGSSIYINQAEEIAGIPLSWPGSELDIGSYGNKVEQMQEQLNAIGKNYPLVPKIVADGISGEKTQEAVQVFQSVFGLPETGIVDYRTWYKIQEIYVAVTRIAELV